MMNKTLQDLSTYELLEGLPELAQHCTPEALTPYQAVKFVEYLRRNAEHSHPLTYAYALREIWIPWLLEHVWNEGRIKFQPTEGNDILQAIRAAGYTPDTTPEEFVRRMVDDLITTRNDLVVATAINEVQGWVMQLKNGRSATVTAIPDNLWEARLQSGAIVYSDTCTSRGGAWLTLAKWIKSGAGPQPTAKPVKGDR